MPASLPTLLSAEEPAAAADTARIVAGIEHRQRSQAEALRQYRSVRHYSVVYHGFGRTLTAAMEVEVSYDAAAGKSFHILSETGSKTICHRVLERALDSEREASADRSLTALDRTNYAFHLVGEEKLAAGPAYVLDVDPTRPSKFLYKGRIWVSQAEFAVEQMEVQPARNPSFWISQTTIRHANRSANGFWLPAHNESTTKVRLGGTAVMTIDYGNYATVPDVAPPSLSATGLPLAAVR